MQNLITGYRFQPGGLLPGDEENECDSIGIMCTIMQIGGKTSFERNCRGDEKRCSSTSQGRYHTHPNGYP